MAKHFDIVFHYLDAYLDMTIDISYLFMPHSLKNLHKQFQFNSIKMEGVVMILVILHVTIF